MENTTKNAEIDFGGDGSALSIYVDDKCVCENLFVEIEKYLCDQGYTEDEIENIQYGGLGVGSMWWVAHRVLMEKLFNEHGVTHVIDVENDHSTPTPYKQYLEIYT